MLAVNLTGAFLCTREAFRAMREQQPRGGRIIDNGSNLPLDANVATMTLMATKMPFIGRG